MGSSSGNTRSAQGSSDNRAATAVQTASNTLLFSQEWAAGPAPWYPAILICAIAPRTPAGPRDGGLAAGHHQGWNLIRFFVAMKRSACALARSYHARLHLVAIVVAGVTILGGC